MHSRAAGAIFEIMKILMHICCGPCAIFPSEQLRLSGHQVHGFFGNPNIHPYQEYVRRRETLAQWAQSIELPVIYEPEYGLEEFIRAVAFRETERCQVCYHLRLEAAAAAARRGKFDALTTTLLYSRFQKHDLVAEIGREAARRHQLDFHYQDFRTGWSEGIRKSRELGMYRQQYCGCIYSEKERYYRKGRDEVSRRPDQGTSLGQEPD
ncbi:MAG: epoxyqueuosine reductase QueH [Thermodesulfobacteriota bacterium]